MSELINSHDNRVTIRWKLLTGASALALTAYVSSPGVAGASDAVRPTVWIELGGQMEQMQGLAAPVIAPFMSVTPTPSIYDTISFAGSQKPARFAFGEEGKISFQPEDSDWVFSAGIRYGRSHSNRHTHRQAASPPVQFTIHDVIFGSPYTYPPQLVYPSYDLVADTQTKSSERHTVLDFKVGKDVGLGLFGRNGSSTINMGIRFASFEANSQITASARPGVGVQDRFHTKYSGLLVFDSPQPTFYEYGMSGHAARSFKGIGPTLSWNASAALLGNKQDGELALDWGIDAALLFGKQKAKTDHTTQAYHFTANLGYPLTYHTSHHSTRSRSVSVPNLGGSIGLSVKYPNFKFSIGYRVDSFLNVMDTGIDTAKKSNLTFNGPYASISIGLGG